MLAERWPAILGPFLVIYSYSPWISEDASRMRGEGGSQGGKEEPAGEKPERRGNSRLRYIFRTVPNAVVTRRCHCAWYPELPLAPHHAAAATRGTAPDTPLSNESTQFDGARRALSLHLGPHGIGVVSFSSVASALFSLGLAPSLFHPYGCSFIPAPPSLSPPYAKREREREGERVRARARERTPSLTRAAFRSRFPSLALTRLPRTLVAASPSSRSRVAHPIPTPYTLDVERRPSPAGGRRASASPSRITPRPRERSVTTKVLVKS